MKVVLVDYHKGNIKSVERSLLDAADSSVDVEVIVSDSPADVMAADSIVLPGVGAFADAMETLEALGLADAIRESVEDGKPFLGICLGLHLMFEGGLEHAVDGNPTPGLGIIPGIVDEMPRQDADGQRFKVPHVGWNSAVPPEDARAAHGGFGSPLFEGIPAGEHFYFTHSFVAPDTPYASALTTHSAMFPCAVQHGSAFGVQFHPEKSSKAGLKLLSNFLEIAAAKSDGASCQVI